MDPEPAAAPPVPEEALAPAVAEAAAGPQAPKEVLGGEWAAEERAQFLCDRSGSSAGWCCHSVEKETFAKEEVVHMYSMVQRTIRDL